MTLGWYLCTIAAGSKRNWDLCKISKTWGVNTNSEYVSKDRARKDDNLLFWLGGKGYLGYAKVTEDMRPPISREETPWVGGQQIYGLVIPLELLVEFEVPRKLRFTNRIQDKTGLEQSMFQRGYMPITDLSAQVVINL